MARSLAHRPAFFHLPTMRRCGIVWARFRDVPEASMIEERRKTVFVTRDLHKRFRIACIQRNVRVQDQAERLVAVWVEQVEEEEAAKRAPPGRKEAKPKGSP